MPPAFDAALDEWQSVTEAAAFEPALTEVRIVARIYRDRLRRFDDGQWVMTSRVKSPLKRLVAGATINTLNSRYRLLRERG